jgi:hypothetical protein
MAQDLLAETPPQESIFDPTKDYLPDLVGDGKKFKSPEDLAKGKYQSDLFIEELKRELKETREYALQLKNDNQSKANLEELIDRLQQQPSGSNQPSVKDDVSSPTLDVDKLKEIARSTYREEMTVAQQNSNFESVMSKVQERWGSNYASALKQQIDELGITKEELNDMARKQPKVLVRTLGLDQPSRQENFQTPPRSSDTRSGFAPTTQRRTWTYYQDIRKKDPATYFSQKIQDQLHQDHMSLGNDFEDGDWNATN